MHVITPVPIVKSPVIFRSPWATPTKRWGVTYMSEQAGKALDSPRLNTVFSGVAALAAVAAVVGVMNGWLTSGSLNSRDIGQLRDQIGVLSTQVANLSAKIDQGPRMDQLQGMDRHLSQLEGGMDALRQQAQSDRDRLTRTETLVQGIDAASKASIGHR